jgi:hypothetical protein
MNPVAVAVVAMVSSYLGWRAIADGLTTVSQQVRSGEVTTVDAWAAGVALVASLAVVAAAAWMLAAIWIPHALVALTGRVAALGAALGMGAWCVQYAATRPAPWPAVAEIALALCAAVGGLIDTERLRRPHHTPHGRPTGGHPRVSR